jgi:hypothetical protein
MMFVLAHRFLLSSISSLVLSSTLVLSLCFCLSYHLVLAAFAVFNVPKMALVAQCPTLCGLSLEILECIIRYLEPDINSIAQLAAVSPRLSAVAVPFLYRAIVVLHEYQIKSFTETVQRPRVRDTLRILTIHLHEPARNNGPSAEELSLELGLLFRFCDLTILTLVGASADTFGQFSAGDRYCTALEELSLYCCDLSPWAISQLLGLPRALRFLTYKGSRPRESYPGGKGPVHTTTDHAAYVTAINQQAYSLVALDVDFPVVNHGPNDPIDLTRLTSLRELTIRSGALHFEDLRDSKTLYVSFSLLPRGLISLTIWLRKDPKFPTIDLVNTYGFALHEALSLRVLDHLRVFTLNAFELVRLGEITSHSSSLGLANSFGQTFELRFGRQVSWETLPGLDCECAFYGPGIQYCKRLNGQMSYRQPGSPHRQMFT